MEYQLRSNVQIKDVLQYTGKNKTEVAVFCGQFTEALTARNGTIGIFTRGHDYADSGREKELKVGDFIVCFMEEGEEYFLPIEPALFEKLFEAK